jgi:hypothetical protein
MIRGSPLCDVIRRATRTRMETLDMNFSRIALFVVALALPCTANAGWFGGSCGSCGGCNMSCGSCGSCGGCFSGLFSGSHGSCGSCGGCYSCCCHQSCGCESQSCGCSSCGSEVKSSCGCDASSSSDAKTEAAPAAPSTKDEKKASEKMEAAPKK